MQMVNESTLMVLTFSGKIHFAQINVDERGEACLENTYNLTNRLIVHEDEQSLKE